MKVNTIGRCGHYGFRIRWLCFFPKSRYTLRLLLCMQYIYKSKSWLIIFLRSSPDQHEEIYQAVSEAALIAINEFRNNHSDVELERVEQQLQETDGHLFEVTYHLSRMIRGI